MNKALLRAFGAKVGRKNVRVFGPITLHDAHRDYSNLSIDDHCVLNGNHYLDLNSRIVLEHGVSLGPGVIIMTHNGYNSNPFLVEHLAHTCGFKDVVIKKGAGIKAGAVITMGVTIGEEAVIAGGAVVNRDIPARTFAAGVPARVVKEIR